jgi:hypothetical protein
MATLTTLIGFNGADGASPFDSFIAEADGDLFGTTAGGAGGAVWGELLSCVGGIHDLERK